MASARLQRYGSSVVIGDLYQEESVEELDAKVVDASCVSAVKLGQVVLPLPGFAVQYPQHEIGSLYAELLKKDGIEFEKQGGDEKTAKGTYRHLISKADNMHLTLDEKDSPSSATTMSMQFDLPAGSYATMLLRELMNTTVARD